MIKIDLSQRDINLLIFILETHKILSPHLIEEIDKILKDIRHLEEINLNEYFIFTVD